MFWGGFLELLRGRVVGIGRREFKFFSRGGLFKGLVRVGVEGFYG